MLRDNLDSDCAAARCPWDRAPLQRELSAGGALGNGRGAAQQAAAWVSRRGTAAAGCWGHCGFVTGVWVLVTKLCLQRKQSRSVPLGLSRGCWVLPGASPALSPLLRGLLSDPQDSAPPRVLRAGNAGAHRDLGTGRRAPLLCQPRSPQPCGGLWGSPAVPSRFALLESSRHPPAGWSWRPCPGIVCCLCRCATGPVSGGHLPVLGEKMGSLCLSIHPLC